jgi:hypothetical protein
MTMQHGLAQLELDRRLAQERGQAPFLHPRPRRERPPGRGREWAAATLARLAWRLDPKAALRAWP